MRSFSGRIVGGILIAIALGWILQLAGAFNWRNTRTANQLIEDRPPVQDPSAIATGTQGFNPNNGQPTQSFRPEDNPSSTQNNPQTQIPGDATDTTETAANGTGTVSQGGETTGGAPVVRAGW